MVSLRFLHIPLPPPPPPHTHIHTLLTFPIDYTTFSFVAHFRKAREKKVLLLGAGMVASPLVEYLGRSSDIDVKLTIGTMAGIALSMHAYDWQCNS